MRVLIISNVWVEPTSTAAGSRMLQLIELFCRQNFEICYATTSSPSPRAFDLQSLGVAVNIIELNNASFDHFVLDFKPCLVIFDRFIVEEQFGWRVAENCPEAIRILDTEDLHCLRKARAKAIKENKVFDTDDLYTDYAKREIASIYRCDLTLMISEVEIDILKTEFNVPDRLLFYIPFLLDSVNTVYVDRGNRADFVSIGNFLHAPNWDALQILKKEVWPKIRKLLPQAKLHNYGAYPSQKVMQLHQPKDGFYVHGAAESAHQVIESSAVLLAPLRFGAGLKGKFIDAMQCGTPSITTRIGAEGMAGGLAWGGAIEEHWDMFAKQAVSLYSDQNLWYTSQVNGAKILNERFLKTRFIPSFLSRIIELQSQLKSHRKQNFTGLMLMHHTAQSTKYLSKWIAEKSLK